VLSALSFLTIVGRGRTPDARTFSAFAPVGALVGAALALLHIGASELWPPLVVAGLVVAADVVLTGALHFDGVADSADGVLPHLERDRRLAVMRAPDVGAFGIVAVLLLILLRVSAISSPQFDAWTCIPVWAMSRGLAALVAIRVPYARPAGLGEAFLGSPARLPLLLTAVAAGALVLGGGVAGATATATMIIGGVAWIALARHRLGGWTGDVLGALIVLTETLALVALAAEWS
jgi:adenosylcobinamide-GDP ribazoletransferase